MPQGFDRLKRSSPKEPRNNSRIVIEGVDEPKRSPGTYSDRIKYDPFSPTYRQRPGAPQPVERT